MLEEYLAVIHKTQPEKIFETMKRAADSLMCENHLEIANDSFDITEIEFYYFNTQTHKDPYAHLHCMQLENGKWYVHEKGSTRGGIDYTFGDGQSFGGILIREIKKRGTDKYITGPAKVRQVIAGILGNPHMSHANLQKELNHNNAIALIPHQKKEKPISYGVRIGLSDKEFCDAKTYQDKLYRFIASAKEKRIDSEENKYSVGGIESLEPN
jgi:hypothetical protein